MGSEADNGERARLIGGAAALGVPLGEPQALLLLRLLAELAHWNKAYNLTSIDDREGMLTHHLLDSLSVAPHVAGETVADVGTGAGFPGLPLAIIDPRRRYTLIDSNNKKIRFVAHVARSLGLGNVEPVHARVEDLAPATAFDTVVTRAFAPLPRLLALVRPLCGPQTRVLAMKSARLDEELRGLDPAWRLDATVALQVPGIDASRALAVLRLAGEGSGRRREPLHSPG
ncbi:MAG TPA: 16S rRNA (guanine(527)-N(7))-methyltransferase RsmG [Steroidobacteraceae bacterium]|nr:16S rRNA (guanine(527)-N(7))-methyltransferase RsmG [Steroidobacteraceae bacterium]